MNRHIGVLVEICIEEIGFIVTWVKLSGHYNTMLICLHCIGYYSVDTVVFPGPVSLEQFPMGTALTTPVSHALRWPFLGTFRLHLLNEPVSYCISFPPHTSVNRFSIFGSAYIIQPLRLKDAFWLLCGLYRCHVASIWERRLKNGVTAEVFLLPTWRFSKKCPSSLVTVGPYLSSK